MYMYRNTYIIYTVPVILYGLLLVFCWERALFVGISSTLLGKLCQCNGKLRLGKFYI